MAAKRKKTSPRKPAKRGGSLFMVEICVQGTWSIPIYIGTSRVLAERTCRSEIEEYRVRVFEYRHVSTKYFDPKKKEADGNQT